VYQVDYLTIEENGMRILIKSNIDQTGIEIPIEDLPIIIEILKKELKSAKRNDLSRH